MTDKILKQAAVREIFEKHLVAALKDIQATVGHDSADLVAMFHEDWDEIVDDSVHTSRDYLRALCDVAGWTYQTPRLVARR